MKIYVAYRFSGADPAEVGEQLNKIFEALKTAGHEYICTFEKLDYFKEQNIGQMERFKYSLEALDNCDTTLAYIDSEEKSEGMLLELGYALAKGKNIILAIKEDIQTLGKLEANTRITFKDIDDLANQLQNLNHVA